MVAVRSSASPSRPVFLDQPSSQHTREHAEDRAELQQAAAGQLPPAELAGALSHGQDREVPDPASLDAVGSVLEDLITEAWADDDVMAALSNPEPEPVFVYQGRGVMGVAGAGEVAAGGLGGSEEQRSSAAEVEVQPSEVAFAEYVLDSALVGAVQDAVAEGVLGASMGTSAGGDGVGGAGGAARH